MRWIVIIVFIIIITSSCEKRLCTMYRYDISNVYEVYKPNDTFYFYVYILPRPTDLALDKKILDSFEILKSNGYSIIQRGGFIYHYTDCCECENFKEKAKQPYYAECIQTN